MCGILDSFPRSDSKSVLEIYSKYSQCYQLQLIYFPAFINIFISFIYQIQLANLIKHERINNSQHKRFQRFGLELNRDDLVN